MTLLARILGLFGLWFHWQNLNEKPGGIHGPGILHGRAWLRFHESRTGLGWSWSLVSHFCHAYIEFGGYNDEDIVLSVALPPVAFWLHFEGLPWRRLWDALDGHTLSLSVHDWTLWWVVWKDDSSWSSKTPRWRHGCWHPADTFLGRWAYSDRVERTQRVVIPLPEGNIEGTVEMHLSTWKRPRWPWPRTMLRATIKPDRAAIVPGKGENSWDCGDDAIYELTCPAKTPALAVAAYVEAVLRDREKYGGRHWQPSAA